MIDKWLTAGVLEDGLLRKLNFVALGMGEIQGDCASSFCSRAAMQPPKAGAAQLHRAYSLIDSMQRGSTREDQITQARERRSR
jgi:hypothetical protein